jgi:hypothetical protein
MAKDWKRIQSPTDTAMGNVAAKATDEHLQAVQDKIQRLYSMRADILGEISSKNTTAINDQLQSAMECISLAITEIEVTYQRMRPDA